MAVARLLLALAAWLASWRQIPGQFEREIWQRFRGVLELGAEAGGGSAVHYVVVDGRASEQIFQAIGAYLVPNDAPPSPPAKG